MTINRRDVVGRGGEALVYAGYFDGQRVVVREVIMPRRNYWRSPDGQRIIKVIKDTLDERLSHAIYPNNLVYSPGGDYPFTA